MTFDLAKVIESKRAMRKRLAALPISTKLRMLDALRVRLTTIRATRVAKGRSGSVRSN